MSIEAQWFLYIQEIILRWTIWWMLFCLFFSFFVQVSAKESEETIEEDPYSLEITEIS